MTEPNALKPSHGVASLYTSKLLDYLIRKTDEGAVTLTDEELTGVCGNDTRPGGSGYNYLMTAIRRMLVDRRTVWRRIHGAGAIERIADAHRTMAIADSQRKHIGRTAKRSVKTLECVDVDSLGETDRPAYYAKALIAKTAAGLADWRTEKKLLARPTTASVDPAKLLDNLIRQA